MAEPAPSASSSSTNQPAPASKKRKGKQLESDTPKQQYKFSGFDAVVAGDVPPVKESSKATREKKGKGVRPLQALVVNEGKGEGNEPEGVIENDLPDFVEFDAVDPFVESNEVARACLRQIVQPAVEEAAEEASVAKSLLSKWAAVSELEAERNPVYFDYALCRPMRERGDGSFYLAQCHDWQSRSWHVILWEEAKVQIGGETTKLQNAALVFFYILITAPHLFRAYGSITKAHLEGDLGVWRLKWDDVTTGVPLRDVQTGCVYGFRRAPTKTQPAGRPYTGMTQRPRDRDDEHEDECVSERVADDRDGDPWNDYQREAFWIVPPDVDANMPTFVSLAGEHFLMTALDGTNPKYGLNTLCLDSAGYDHLILPSQAKAVFSYVVDQLSPRTESGKRVTKQQLTRKYVETNYAKLRELAPLKPTTLLNLLTGITWAWVLRPLAKELELDPAMFPSGKVPLHLLPTKAERSAVRQLKADDEKKRAGESGVSEDRAWVANAKREKAGVKPTKKSTSTAPLSHILDLGNAWADGLDFGFVEADPPEEATNDHGASHGEKGNE